MGRLLPLLPVIPSLAADNTRLSDWECARALATYDGSTTRRATIESEGKVRAENEKPLHVLRLVAQLFIAKHQVIACQLR
jgi:hypothetical protein